MYFKKNNNNRLLKAILLWKRSEKIIKIIVLLPKQLKSR